MGLARRRGLGPEDGPPAEAGRLRLIDVSGLSAVEFRVFVALHGRAGRRLAEYFDAGPRQRTAIVSEVVAKTAANEAEDWSALDERAQGRVVRLVAQWLDEQAEAFDRYARGAVMPPKPPGRQRRR